MLGHSVVGERVLGELTSSSTGAFFLGADTGVFTITDEGTTLYVPPRLFADSGEFVFTGFDSEFVYDRPIVAETGVFALTFNDAGVLRSATLTAETGVFTLASDGAGFIYLLNLAADTGVFTWTGFDSTLRLTQPKFGILAAPQGAYPFRARASYRRAVH